jgi:hypothetical protein
MIDCAIIGDSIAVDLAYKFPHCIMDAKIGIGSAAIIGRVQDPRINSATVVIISAGSNDPDNPRLTENLVSIRTKITGKVIWILPINQRAAKAVIQVAGLNQDRVVSFSPARDNVHPSNNNTLAKNIGQIP